MVTETCRWIFVGALGLAALTVLEYLGEMAVKTWLAARRAEREDAEWRERYGKQRRVIN